MGNALAQKKDHWWTLEYKEFLKNSVPNSLLLSLISNVG
jgi:hypothetical protein